jgi:2-hydroxychromene-2-carboxylate isomerase
MSTAPALLFSRLVDDASMFPPGDLPLDDAVRAHHEHRTAPYADLVGTFVCTDQQLADVARRARATGTAPLRVSVVVTGGAGGIEPVVRYGDRSDDVEVTGVEVRLRDEDDLSRNALRVVRMCDSCMDSENAFVEIGLQGGWERALDVVADAGYAAKLRTGGLDADLFPSAAEVAGFVAACLDREVQFKCTAGLHNAVRHTAAETGFEHHGFLNVLLATRACLDGASTDDVAAVLENRNGADLAAQAAALDEQRATGVRRWFTSFGSCSISEPVDDLTGLGLVTR